MRNIDELKTTTNSQVYKRARKQHLENTGKINCSYCSYHQGENDKSKWYGGWLTSGFRKSRGLTYPSWKLASKNPKQWMPKNRVDIRIIDYSLECWFLYSNDYYLEINVKGERKGRKRSTTSIKFRKIFEKYGPKNKQKGI